VEGHWDGQWVGMVEKVSPYFAEVVGAKEKEVACMGTLTANLHLMMSTFYKPTQTRYKILCEAKAFPSDQVRPSSLYPLHGTNAFTVRIRFAGRRARL
jgi:kynureninase